MSNFKFPIHAYKKWEKEQFIDGQNMVSDMPEKAARWMHEKLYMQMVGLSAMYENLRRENKQLREMLEGKKADNETVQHLS